MKKNGIGLLSVVFLVFLVLKLTGVGEVAHWSWWWVTAPLWAPSVIGVVIVLGTFVLGFLGLIVAALFAR
jgi:hypothetical protein